MLSQAIKAGFKRSFTTGLAALLPTTLTVLILITGFGLANDYIGKPVGNIVLWSAERLGGQRLDDWVINHTGGMALVDLRMKDHWIKSAIGFPVAIVLVFFLGFLLASFLGRRILDWFDHLVERFPIVGSIYGYGKKVSDFLLKGNRQIEFKSVVLVKYPYEGLWSIGFVTGEGINVLSEREGKEMITVYIPNAPSLITGWMLILPKTDVIPIPMTVEEAIPYAVSAGVLLPDRLKPGRPIPAEETA